MSRNPTKPLLVQVSSGINRKDQCTTILVSVVAEGDIDDDCGCEKHCVTCNKLLHPGSTAVWSCSDQKANLVKTFCLLFGVQFSPSLNSQVEDQFQCCLPCLEELKLLDRYYKKLELVRNQLDIVREHLMQLMATGYATNKLSTESSHSQKQWKSIMKSVLEKLVPAWILNLEFRTMKAKMDKNAAFTRKLNPQMAANDEEIVQNNFNLLDDTNPDLAQDTETSNMFAETLALDGGGHQELKCEYDDNDHEGVTNSYYYAIEGEVGDEFIEEDTEYYDAGNDNTHTHFSQWATEQKEDIGIGNLDLAYTGEMTELNQQDEATTDKLSNADRRRTRSSKPRPKLDETFHSQMKSLKIVKPKPIPQNNGKGRLDCHFCKKKFASTDVRRNHEKNHRLSSGDRKVYCCLFCSRTVTCRGSFIKHLENKHMATGEVKYGDTFYFYTCDSTDCNKCFPTQQLLENHIQHVHSTSDTPLPIKCVKCEKIFAEESHHEAHIQNTHCVGKAPAWACEYCHLDFEVEKMLQRHMSLHLVNVTRPEVPCPVCGEKLRNSVELSMHKFNYHGLQLSESEERTHKKSLQCDDCGRRFSSAKGLLKHSKRHISGKLAYKHFPCSLCGKVLRSQEGLEWHAAGHKRQRCRFCNRYIHPHQNVRRHEYNCNKEKYLDLTPFLCESCYGAFASEHELNAHHIECLKKKSKVQAGTEVTTRRQKKSVKSDQNQDQSGFCEICGKHFKWLHKHKQIHNRLVSQDVFKASRNCKFGCSESFYQLSQLRQHYIAKHGEKYVPEGSVYCHKCFRVFGNDIKLKKHEKSHFGRYGCEVCGKTYACLYNLRNHKYEHVKDAQLLCCKVCGKEFTKPVTYKNHLKTHEEDRNNYNRTDCLHCGKNMSVGRSYRLHLYNEHREHFLTASTPFYCSICYQTFHSQEDLDTHFTQHPKCQYCHRRFVSNFKVSVHEVKHTGAQPYQCPTCGKRFGCDANLGTHMKIHTGERPLHCTVCPDNVGFFRRKNLEQHMQNCHTS